MNNWFTYLNSDEVSYDDIMKMADNGKFTTWGYQPFGLEESGYEGVNKYLSKYNPRKLSLLRNNYIKAEERDDENAKKEIQYKMDEMVEDVLQHIRSVNLFPVVYYSDNGIYNEISKCISDNANLFNGDVVIGGYNNTSGVSLCKYLFPNLFTSYSHNLKSLYERFFNDEELRKAIKIHLFYNGEKGNTSTTVKSILGCFSLSGSHPTNFPPMTAKCIYERFAPPEGVIYDSSCGFGGRMLGCLTSKNNYRYVGCDPNTETMYNLHRLGSYIENITGRDDSYELHCIGSELFKGDKNSIDFMFTSPPYYDLEVYSDEKTQCYNKYTTLDDWIKYFVEPTINNIIYMLKPSHVYAVNIKDFNSGGKEVKFVDEWIRISKEYGAKLYKTCFLGLQPRPGTANKKSTVLQTEGIYIFKKQ